MDEVQLGIDEVFTFNNNMITELSIIDNVRVIKFNAIGEWATMNSQKEYDDYVIVQIEDNVWAILNENNQLSFSQLYLRLKILVNGFIDAIEKEKQVRLLISQIQNSLNDLTVDDIKNINLDKLLKSEIKPSDT
jgi:hypothetical protein